MVPSPHQKWIGSHRERDDLLSPGPARRMLALLDRSPDGLDTGDPLPPGWHWLYLNHGAPRSELDSDGHEKRGGFLPPVTLPRRMWAGGRIRLLRPLILGERVHEISTVASVEEKHGRSGRLVFVTVRREISGEGGLAVEEERDLVYRSPPEAGPGYPAAPPPPEEPQWTETFQADEITLFRFSALTFNGHRIHYDHPYATRAEGYPGLVVHGPLLALLLLDAGARRLSSCGFFSYRAKSPLFCGETVHLRGKAGPAQAPEEGEGRDAERLHLWAAHPERGVCMNATLDP